MIRTLFLTHHPEQDASSRYRVYQYLPLLERNGFACEVRPFSTLRLFQMLRNEGSPPEKAVHALYCTARRALDLMQLGRYDLVVIHREVYPFFSPRAERIVFRWHKKVVFDLDDAVYVGHDRNALKYPWLYRFKYGGGLDDVFCKSQQVIVGSSVLADHVRQFNPEVVTVPTVVDLDRYPFTLPERFDDRPVTIGWYGSNSTSPYLHQILPALQQLAQKHSGRLRFRFIGDGKLALDLPNLEVLPFRLESEIDDLRSMDIGLMPLPDTEWTRAKCAFKAIQYMSLGIPTVVTPIGMAAVVVRHEETGLHATEPKDWFKQLSRLIADVALRQRLAVAGREEVAQKYSLQRWGEPFVETLRRLHATSTPARVLAVKTASVATGRH